MIDLSIIIVSWNVRDLLARCLESIFHFPPSLSIEIIVVDNDSTDGSAQMVRQHFSGVGLIANQENVGFTRGNNQGLRASRGRFLLLLNPDTEVRPGALGRLAHFLDEHPEVGAVGPRLLNSDGTVQSSRRRFPTLATALVESTVLQRYFPRSGLLARYHCADRSADEVQEVDWLVGAALVVRRTAMEQVGMLDEDFFMYFEELDWCYRLRQAGWQIVYLPRAEVVHHYGRSSEQVLSRRDLYFQASKCHYFRKHHGRLAAALLQAFLVVTYLFQIGEEGAKLLLGHKRALRRQRLDVLCQVLRSGFHRPS